VLSELGAFGGTVGLGGPRRLSPAAVGNKRQMQNRLVPDSGSAADRSWANPFPSFSGLLARRRRDVKGFFEVFRVFAGGWSRVRVSMG
jgi:hypothetical protein